jgi:arsenite-transporting ATPase
VGSLLWIAEHHDSGNYDVIVVDAAPTGETLRLLSLPEAAKWWMEKVEPIGRRITKLTGPLIQRVVGMPMPGDEVFNAGEDLFRKLEHMHGLLADPDRTSVRVVLTLEQVVIKEAQRSFTYFHLYDYPTDLVVANRILPEEVGPYFRGWFEAQQRYGPMVEETFAPIPIRYAPFFDREVVGIPMLHQLGDALYGDTDPSQHFYRGRPYSVVRDDGEFVLSLELPFAAKEEIHLSRHADELVIDLGGTWRRNLVLPRALLEAPTRGAKFEDHVLKIRFAAPPRSTSGGTTRG